MHRNWSLLSLLLLAVALTSSRYIEDKRGEKSDKAKLDEKQVTKLKFGMLGVVFKKSAELIPTRPGWKKLKKGGKVKEIDMNPAGILHPAWETANPSDGADIDTMHGLPDCGDDSEAGSNTTNPDDILFEASGFYQAPCKKKSVVRNLVRHNSSKICTEGVCGEDNTNDNIATTATIEIPTTTTTTTTTTTASERKSVDKRVFVSNNTKTPTTGIWATSKTTKAENYTPEVKSETSHANKLRRKGMQNSTYTYGTTPTTTETMPSTTTKAEKTEVTTSTSNTEPEAGNSETGKNTQSTWYTTMSTTGKVRPEPETGYPDTGESAQAYTTMTTTKTNTMKPETETTTMWTKEMETSETDSFVTTVAAIKTNGRRKPEDKTETSNEVREEFLKKPCIDSKGTLVYIKIGKLQICNPTSQGTWIEPCSTACNQALKEYHNSLDGIDNQDSTGEMTEHSKWQSKERKYKKRVLNHDDAKINDAIGETYRRRYDPTYSWGKKDNMWSSWSSRSAGDTRSSRKSNKGVDLMNDYEQLGETYRERYEPTYSWGKKDKMWSSWSSRSAGDTRSSRKSNKGVALMNDYEQLGETYRERYKPTSPWRQESKKDSARNSDKKRSIDLGRYYENHGETFGRKYDPIYKRSHGYYDMYGRKNKKYYRRKYEEYYRKHYNDDKEDLDDDICEKIYDDNYVDQYRELCIKTLGQSKENRKRACRKMAKRARESSYDLCRRVMKKRVDMKAKVPRDSSSLGNYLWSMFK